MKGQASGPMAAILTVVLGTAPMASAYPIAPRTLWDLVGEAERVVLARVDVVTRAAGNDGAFQGSTARLEILETWKGPPGSSVEVSFFGGMICPAPDRYIEGETVLAFLESGEARLAEIKEAKERDTFAERWSGRWFTVALSYGTLYPEPEAVPVFRELVADALELRAHGPVPEAERRRWLVRAAVDPATRWHGLYDLARDADTVHSFYDHRPASPDVGLASEDLARLAGAFHDDPALDNTVPMMLKVLAGYPSRDVDLAGLAAVETALSEKKVPYWVHQAILLVRARFGDVPQKPKRKKGKGECNFADDPLLRSLDMSDDEVRREWAQTRQRLGLPSVAPLPRRPRPYRGVGGDTPS